LFHFDLKLLDSAAQIELKINKEIATYLNTKARSNIGTIQSKLKPKIARAILDSPEIRSLSSGKLKKDFGLAYDPSLDIAQSVAETCNVTLGTGISTKSLRGTLIKVEVQPDSLSNLLLASFGSFVSETSGENVPWLSWLLTAGDSPVVMGYDVSYGNYKRSRAGGAIMKKGGMFRVDPSYSGVAGNNFISRALQSADTISQVESIITQVFK